MDGDLGALETGAHGPTGRQTLHGERMVLGRTGGEAPLAPAQTGQDGLLVHGPLTPLGRLGLVALPVRLQLAPTQRLFPEV